MKKASLKKFQQENPSGLLSIATSIPYAEYTDKHYFSGFFKTGWEIFKAARLCSDEKDFYRYPESSKKSLSTLFTVKNESEGDLLVVFVADICKDGRVQPVLILSDAAWKEVIASNQKVMRVEQFYLHILEEQMHVPA